MENRSSPLGIDDEGFNDKRGINAFDQPLGNLYICSYCGGPFATNHLQMHVEAHQDDIVHRI